MEDYVAKTTVKISGGAARDSSVAPSATNRNRQEAACGTMRDSTYRIVKMALDADGTVSAADRQAILAFCREPVIPLAAVHADPPPAGERYLRPREAAAEVRVSTRTIQRWMRSGLLPSRKVVGIRRVAASDLRAVFAKDSPPANCRFPKPTEPGDWGSKDGMAAG